MGRLEGGIEAKGGLEFVEGVGVAVEGEEEEAAVVVGFGGVGIQFEGEVDFFLGGVEAPRAEEERAEVVMGGEGAGIEAHGGGPEFFPLGEESGIGVGLPGERCHGHGDESEKGEACR